LPIAARNYKVFADKFGLPLTGMPLTVDEFVANIEAFALGKQV
jgi:hypothetical protein